MLLARNKQVYGLGSEARPDFFTPYIDGSLSTYSCSGMTCASAKRPILWVSQDIVTVESEFT